MERCRNVKVGEETGNSGTLAGCIWKSLQHGLYHNCGGTRSKPHKSITRDHTKRVVWDAYFGLSGTLQNAMLAVAQRTTFPTWTLRLMHQPSDGLCGRYTSRQQFYLESDPDTRILFRETTSQWPGTCRCTHPQSMLLMRWTRWTVPKAAFVLAVYTRIGMLPFQLLPGKHFRRHHYYLLPASGYCCNSQGGLCTAPLTFQFHQFLLFSSSNRLYKSSR